MIDTKKDGSARFRDLLIDNKCCISETLVRQISLKWVSMTYIWIHCPWKTRNYTYSTSCTDWYVLYLWRHAPDRSWNLEMDKTKITTIKVVLSSWNRKKRLHTKDLISFFHFTETSISTGMAMAQVSITPAGKITLPSSRRRHSPKATMGPNTRAYRNVVHILRQSRNHQ